MPKLSHTMTLPNKNKGTKFTVTMEGLADFSDLTDAHQPRIIMKDFLYSDNTTGGPLGLRGATTVGVDAMSSMLSNYLETVELQKNKPILVDK